MTDALQNALTDVMTLVPKLIASEIAGVVIVGAGGGLIKQVWSLSPHLFQQLMSGKEIP